MVKARSSMTASMRSEFDDFIGKYGFEQFGYIQVGVPARDGIELRKQGLNSRSPLTAYMEENGYGHADVYPQDGFDAVVKENGLRVIYRGMPDGDALTGAEKHENFMYDTKYYIGSGMFGDGQYFGDELTGKSYAVGGSSGHEGNGAVIMAALKPDAKTATYSSIRADVEERYPQLAVNDGLLSVYARTRGYDAIVVGNGDDLYVNVINRDALLVSENIRRVSDYGYA